MKTCFLQFLCFSITTITGVCAATIAQPEFSEFSVVFPDKPKGEVSSFTSPDGGSAEAISFQLISNDSFLKAEFVPIEKPELLDAMTDQEIRQRGLEYGKHNGLTVSEVTVSRKGKVRIASLRGTKVLSQNGREKAVTYEMLTYYGRTAIMSLLVGAPSKVYPTEPITHFLASVKWP